MSNFRKALKLILNEFIYGGHIQSFGAASVVFVSGILLKIQITWDILFIMYLLFYTPYLYNRFKEIKIDYLTNPQRTKYLKTYIYQAPLIIYFASFTLIGSLIYFSNFKALIFGLLLLIFGIFYTVFFKKVTKKIYVFKNIYVSIFFALLPFFLVVYYSFPLTSYLMLNILLLSLFIFLKAFLTQIFLDIKDIKSDKKERLRTFPVIMGKEKTFMFLSIFNFIVTITVPIVLSLYLNIFPKSILMLIFTVPFSFYCYNLAKRKNYFGYIFQSGEFLLWLFLIFIGKIIL
ncbi:UbiA family prenyltransferase [Candidatus Parcubacteria bacterium]|nr:UbiA family prenyltransferase [Candidatus Parcubacteria bacterium]